MKPLFHPRLVNAPFGDPALYVDFLFERRALLFDIGDLAPLSARSLLRVTHAFVSHAHLDHFVGFDRLLRLALGRAVRIHLFGPPGFLARVEHKLGAYTWNLVGGYSADCTFRVTEVGATGTLTADFRSGAAFAPGEVTAAPIEEGVLLDEAAFTVRTVLLDHRIPCLGFRLEERLHVNVWKNRLEAMGLPTGPWLRAVKLAVLRGDPDDVLFRVPRPEGGGERRVALGELRERILEIVPGQTLAYVADAAFHPENAARIVELARGVDLLFIEAAFLEEDAARAREKAHLTARQAGELARLAGAAALVPFHFSPKYSGDGERLEREAREAFTAGGHG